VYESTATEDETTTDEDAVLLEAVRRGDQRAYGRLWARHHTVALRVARSITSTASQSLRLS
jgi:hypothetical protein